MAGLDSSEGGGPAMIAPLFSVEGGGGTRTLGWDELDGVGGARMADCDAMLPVDVEGGLMNMGPLDAESFGVEGRDGGGGVITPPTPEPGGGPAMIPALPSGDELVGGPIAMEGDVKDRASGFVGGSTSKDSGLFALSKSSPLKGTASITVAPEVALSAGKAGRSAIVS